MYFCTEWLHSIEHRKWRETKQQPSMLPGPAVPGCCLVSFDFLWAGHPVAAPATHRNVTSTSSHKSLGQ